MTVALELAKKAEVLGEVPVGAVVVLNDEVIGQGLSVAVILLLMPKSWRYAALRNNKTIIACPTPLSMSHWSLAPCVQGPSFTVV